MKGIIRTVLHTCGHWGAYKSASRRHARHVGQQRKLAGQPCPTCAVRIDTD